MTNRNGTADDKTYPVGDAARLTGLTPERLRAWESRYGAVRPRRSEGGTRLYSASDLERLRLLRAAVDSGRRIGRIARLDLEALRACLEEASPMTGRFAAVIAAIEALDPIETRRLLSAEMAGQNALEFTTEYMIPLVHELGRLWQIGRISVASEHLATSLLRSMAAMALGASEEVPKGPKVLFATPPGERHDLGLLAAALAAMAAGGDSIFLGADVPEIDLLDGMRRTAAAALAIGLVTLSPRESEAFLGRLRESLPDEIPIWIGGPGTRGCRALRGVTRVTDLDRLGELITDLRLDRRTGRLSASKKARESPDGEASS
jgi:DNA-binding transcriptional MerR regulator